MMTLLAQLAYQSGPEQYLAFSIWLKPTSWNEAAQIHPVTCKCIRHAEVPTGHMLAR